MNDVESIPGSCLAFGGTASVGLSAKKEKRNVKKATVLICRHFSFPILLVLFEI